MHWSGGVQAGLVQAGRVQGRAGVGAGVLARVGQGRGMQQGYRGRQGGVGPALAGQAGRVAGQASGQVGAGTPGAHTPRGYAGDRSVMRQAPAPRVSRSRVAGPSR